MKRISLLFILEFILMGFISNAQKPDFFPGIYPAPPVAFVTDNGALLHNNVISLEWQLKDRSIGLKQITNRFTGETLDLRDIRLFVLNLQNGMILSNKDFLLQGALSIVNIQGTDSLPQKALRYPGKEIRGQFLSRDGKLRVHWKAQLREGSNYIRQNLVIQTSLTPVLINRITFFDGRLKDAIYAGSVLGSPIQYKQFFFGMEHPIAKSKALLTRTIGQITGEPIPISDFIHEAGNYEVAIEHGGGSDDFNINAVSLVQNGRVISSQKQPLNGYGGNNIYRLKLDRYDKKNTYDIQLAITNPDKATGLLHLYKHENDILNFYVDRTDTLLPGKAISVWSLMGVAPKDQVRRSFAYYIERERARPYKQFLHYNCWWDITDDGASSFTSGQLLERMEAWNRKFIKPFSIKLNAFVFDDGWDDLDSVWYFDPVKFPYGFSKQAELCRKYNSGIGVWMSPFGGYLENQRRRIQSAKREGLEINGKGLSLAGPHYYERFLERAIDMLKNYQVNYFKFDGFGGSEPQYLPDMEAGARLIENLRKINPEVYVNITVGSWPSPFWLQYADCTWRGSGDLHNAGQGNVTQKFMTYRDGTLHNNIVKRAPFYPLNSIMVVGIAYANLGHPSRFINNNKHDFTDMVRSFFCAGSSLQELYISHDRMKSDFWPILAEAAQWAKDNENILKDVHWIGGSPINLEAYGFASWLPGKGIITLRNPSDKPISYDLLLNKDFELPETFIGNYMLHSPWDEDKLAKSTLIHSGKTHKIELRPFEVKVLEAIKSTDKSEN